MALRIAATIQVQEGHRVHKRDLGSPLVAVFAHRSATALASVLGSLLAGAGYVPLNRTFPVMRTRLMFGRSECQTIIVDRESLLQLNALLDGDDRQLLVIAPDRQDLQWHRQQ
jgi:non-ribosomal peptide synthetase component F